MAFRKVAVAAGSAIVIVSLPVGAFAQSQQIQEV
jgi:hypothetical protein